MKSYPSTLLLCTLLGLGCNTANAQRRSYIDNLVKNPGFEEYAHCPTRLGSFDTDVRYWNCPTEGSTDYFSGCSEVMGVPSNYNGYQEALNGKAYAGLYLLAPGNYREYVQVGLRKKLEKDSVYQLKLGVSLAELSGQAVGELGFLFSDSPLRLPTKAVIGPRILDSLKAVKKRLEEVPLPPFSESSMDWEEVELFYRATGSERYLVIGNFRDDSLSTVYANPKGRKPGAYYYIDGLMLFRVGAGKPQPSYRLDTTYIFEDILFPFDQYELDEAGKREARDMYLYLRERPDYHIFISGHTDNAGGDDYNRVLSERRARRIADELIACGISPQRVHVASFGSERPVAPNDSDRGRQLNRRAEFVLRRRSP